jgi:hypothetical protein
LPLLSAKEVKSKSSIYTNPVELPKQLNGKIQLLWNCSCTFDNERLCGVVVQPLPVVSGTRGNGDCTPSLSPGLNTSILCLVSRVVGFNPGAFSYTVCKTAGFFLVEHSRNNVSACTNFTLGRFISDGELVADIALLQ